MAILYIQAPIFAVPDGPMSLDEQFIS